MDIKIIANGFTKRDYRQNKWGLSLLIDGDLLFDTFCSAPALENWFSRYGIDVGALKYIVISHEHWDHTGGLRWILEQNKHITVYVCAGTGADFRQNIWDSGAVLVEVTKPLEIKPGLFTTGQIVGSYNGSAIFEQALILKQDSKLAVVTGCSHPGVLKILSLVGSEHKGDIDLLLGGFHLMDKPPAEIEQITTVFDRVYGIKHIAPLHCTGLRAVRFFKKTIPHRLLSVSCGDSLEFDPRGSTWKPKKTEKGQRA
jgi:7,8-dihydropterin-6-yl-methyl-4-(beta-D-ribofuranosyl)aminobenzene 5'-phosphate synthase